MSVCGECLMCMCWEKELHVCVLGERGGGGGGGGDIESTDNYIGGWNPPSPQVDTHTLFRYTCAILGLSFMRVTAVILPDITCKYVPKKILAWVAVFSYKVTGWESEA